MENGAVRDHKSVWDIAKFYLDEFLRDAAGWTVMDTVDGFKLVKKQ